MNPQELINNISKLQTYKFSENDDMILVNREEVIFEIIKFYNNCKANNNQNFKIIIGNK